MTKKEIETIVEKANTAYVGVVAYRIKAKTIPTVDYLADFYSGVHQACLDLLDAFKVDLNKCGLIDVKEAYRRAKDSLILDGIADKSFGNFR